MYAKETGLDTTLCSIPDNWTNMQIRRYLSPRPPKTPLKSKLNGEKHTRKSKNKSKDITKNKNLQEMKSREKSGD